MTITDNETRLAMLRKEAEDNGYTFTEKGSLMKNGKIAVFLCGVTHDVILDGYYTYFCIKYTAYHEHDEYVHDIRPFLERFGDCVQQHRRGSISWLYPSQNFIIANMEGEEYIDTDFIMYTAE